LSQASRHASMPSLCGMLVYTDVTSIETRMVPEGRFEDNQWCLSNVRVALLHEAEGGHLRIRRFFSVGCPFAEAMSLPCLLTLCIFGNREKALGLSGFK
jgi:hypothetical protein